MKIKYKGAGKHTIEELEEIVEDLKTSLIDLCFESNWSKEKELKELVSEILHSAKNVNKDFPELTLTPEIILTNIVNYIERFQKDHNINL